MGMVAFGGALVTLVSIAFAEAGSRQGHDRLLRHEVTYRQPEVEAYAMDPADRDLDAKLAELEENLSFKLLETEGNTTGGKSLSAEQGLEELALRDAGLTAKGGIYPEVQTKWRNSEENATVLEEVGPKLADFADERGPNA